ESDGSDLVDEDDLAAGLKARHPRNRFREPRCNGRLAQSFACARVAQHVADALTKQLLVPKHGTPRPNLSQEERKPLRNSFSRLPGGGEWKKSSYGEREPPGDHRRVSCCGMILNQTFDLNFKSEAKS